MYLYLLCMGSLFTKTQFFFLSKKAFDKCCAFYFLVFGCDYPTLNMTQNLMHPFIPCDSCV